MKKRPLQRSLRHMKSGFTLIEMILVIALIVLLAGVVVMNVDNIFGDQQAKLMKLRVNDTMKTPLFKYRMDMGSYPSSEEGLRALVERPSNDRGRWRGPYLESEEVLIDDWGSPLQYRFPGTRNAGSYDLYSLGPDKVESADDIGNW